ncbi:terpenoid cyclases/Protein prenyltransferase [Neurospora crassa]|uniref:Geranylgeranyl transferase type I beta subunit n=1 Tax=Neurospora crassa (strain ATCC 24698 / 74-OR23-1A / CBS 708.71 / DSM 1257 / FGSC 987) TaxID=367110 RepID=Q7S4G5_NEUCR|nr:geranylgeranyl transferase type I beta subunit [Neurospora crassa OR74A]EAA30405.1 geranylgeranyl transferase type I beta subunit [Neurospora crassa OR74A]KHE84092.1 terpenoid cyclases/Protein prenyltransferase [Neurospora crassa]|eukprot:XP_959641.1 geranylgeranyl transferase type I beta subunit [Neurospora crassa OR74A]
MENDNKAQVEEPEQEWPYLDVLRHLRYWKMCIRAPLPHVYLSNESNRLALAYFIVNSVTLLTPPPSERTPQTPEPLISREDKRAMRKWVLHHQHPTGGFCGTSSLVFPLHSYDTYNSNTKTSDEPDHAGLANITSTLFALQLLALLADEEDEAAGENVFEGVDRVGTLRFLKSLQREDGSFGEALSDLPGHGRFIAGGYDMRYCYIATAIRWILRGDVEEGSPGWVEDFDTEALARYILNSQTYDRGFAGNSQDEAHAGYAYCAIAALTLLDRPLTSTSSSSSSSVPHKSPLLHSSIRDLPGLIHWLASRPFVYLEPPPPSADQDPDTYIYQEDDLDDPNFLLPPTPADLLCLLSQTAEKKGHDKIHVAFNGRTNKVADTCYFWWVGGALANLGRLDSLVDREAARRFLLEKMQHRIGGFGKSPGSPPDLYHSFFGLAILGLMGDEREGGKVRGFDAGLAVPRETVGVIERARRKLIDSEKGGKGVVDGGKELDTVEMGLELRSGGERPKWLGACGY